MTIASRPSPSRVWTDGDELQPLRTGWEVAPAEPGSHLNPASIDGLGWIAAAVPGTVASALRAAGLPDDNLDGRDWWFRTVFDGDAIRAAAGTIDLRLDGVATVSQVFLNGELLAESDSMFAAQVADVTSRLRSENELVIRCVALDPLLAASRRPRARWRTRVVSDGNLRWFRTSLVGRAPGFSPGPAPVGPWRDVALHRRGAIRVDALRMQSRLEGDVGVLHVRCRLRALDGSPLGGVELEAMGPTGTHRTALALDARNEDDHIQGELRIPGVATWWPHTHGEQPLYEVRLRLRESAGPTVHAGKVGFRSLAPGASVDHDVERDGLDLHINGVRTFVRGAVWTPVDAIGLAPPHEALRAALECVRAAGMNMLRIPGIGAYESDAFHDLCDELGVLVWQDFMFANLDYPFADPAFRAAAEDEASAVLARLAASPSVAVLCGNSEIEQQVAMLGLDPSLGRGEFFGTTLPALVSAESDAVYVPSSPSGGDLPFRPGTGIANYYGVGAYRRPLDDARTSNVRFAAECLAFSNVPDAPALAALGPAERLVHHPAWKRGVPRDVGSGWDFEDVRDHYLRLLFGVEPAELRRVDHQRYLDLSRAVTGEVMAEVFAEWRRPASASGGGLVLWLRDLVPGAGWGVLDHLGNPKAAYHHLRRALAPVAVWTTDEGLNGTVAHVANDRDTALSATLRVALYRDLERCVESAEAHIHVPAHGGISRNLETIIGRFVDVGWAYRFGPPAHDAVVVSLERDGALVSQSFRFPAGRPMRVEPSSSLGLVADATPHVDGSLRLAITSRRLAYGVRVAVPGFSADDDAFSIEPGATRSVLLRPAGADVAFAGGELTALNLAGGVPIRLSTR